jgi:hypothetical protein
MNVETRTSPADALGRVEYVVESRRNGARETWLVMRADKGAVRRYAQLGLEVTPGARIVVEAETLKPIGILERDIPPPNRPAGFNPYFDPPLAA